MTSGIVTVVLLLLFLGGWIWAWSPRRKRDFDEASRLPLEDDHAADEETQPHKHRNGHGDSKR